VVESHNSFDKVLAVSDHEVNSLLSEGLALFGACLFCVRGFSAGGGFQLAFAQAIALAFNEEQIDVMGKAVDQGGDASSIGKDGVPVFEHAI